MPLKRHIHRTLPIAEKAVCRSLFLTIWHQKYTPTDCFFSDFAHWDVMWMLWDVAITFLYSFDVKMT